MPAPRAVPPAPAQLLPSPARLDSSAGQGFPPPSTLYVRRVRPVLDRVGAALLALATAPAWIAVALLNLAVLRDPRKVLFLQPRAGFRGETFRIVKFRTMVSEGEALRLTRVGRWLRNLHLDELPQLWNVLRGEMSLVGPRPEMVEIQRWAEEHVPGFHDRLVVRPGMTGLAQINQGYTPIDVDHYTLKLAYDLSYACQVSARLDAAILLRTVAWVARGRGSIGERVRKETGYVRTSAETNG